MGSSSLKMTVSPKSSMLASSSAFSQKNFASTLAKTGSRMDFTYNPREPNRAVRCVSFLKYR